MHLGLLLRFFELLANDVVHDGVTAKALLVVVLIDSFILVFIEILLLLASVFVFHVPWLATSDVLSFQIEEFFVYQPAVTVAGNLVCIVVLIVLIVANVDVQFVARLQRQVSRLYH